MDRKSKSVIRTEGNKLRKFEKNINRDLRQGNVTILSISVRNGR